MRWATFRTASATLPLVGCLQDDLLYTLPPGETLLRLLRLGPEGLREQGDRALRDPWSEVPLREAQLMAPVPVPPSVRDYLAFEGHYQAAGRAVDPQWYREPAFYFSNPAAVCGPYDPVPVPSGSTEWDYEVEVAVVVAGTVRDLRPEDAGRYIGGYMVMCDFSARDVQAREVPLGLGPVKSKDTATSLGPFLVTPDELPAPDGGGGPMRLRATVDGRLLSDVTLDGMRWSFPELMAQAARGTELRAGDVLGSGTPLGGCIRDLRRLAGNGSLPAWLTPGNTLKIHVDGLGALRHDIVASHGPSLPGA
jgi:2-keto-4-pentenoate hydratase/2-oxohepta-3-ene-1,7-dioic acid hydratase in catechol pathway